MSLASLHFDFRVRQIIVGNVHSADEQPQQRIDQGLRHLHFFGAKCSVTLVEEQQRHSMAENANANGSPPMKMLVDCASPYERDQLLQALRTNGIQSVAEVTHLLISHWHTDHCGQIPLFPNAKLITPCKIRRFLAASPQATPDEISRHFGLPDSIELAVYSGHSSDDLVAIVRQRQQKPANNEEVCISNSSTAETERTIVIAGDLFECADDWAEDGCSWRQNSLCPEKQTQARRSCWERADWIVPGHGAAFPAVGNEGAKINEKKQSSSNQLQQLIAVESDFLSAISKLEFNCKGSVKFEQLFCFQDQSGGQFRVHLIRTEKANILVDTGGTAQRMQLLQALECRGMSPAEVSHLVVSQPGHQLCANLGHFPRSVIFLCHDISIPPAAAGQAQPLYAGMNPFVSLADGLVNVFRPSPSLHSSPAAEHSCHLSVLIAIPSTEGPMKFVLIGHPEMDQQILANLPEEQREEVQFLRPFSTFGNNFIPADGIE